MPTASAGIEDGGFGPPLAEPASTDTVSVQRVMFPAIFDPRDLGDKVWGFLYRPKSTPVCTSSALLLLHDISYASHQWDLPYEPERYSTARALAAAGYPTVTIDLPGHGSTDGGDGFRMHVALYADIASQVVDRM
ncbi:MAG: hypothetical protein ACRDYV_07450, partial [Acidimicrobiia bacterium]